MEINIHYEIDTISDIYEDYVYMSKYETKSEEKGTCKYCGTTDLNKFKSKAHLAPEFTGNKDSFCYNECDDCNNTFSAYEYSLKSFGAFKNSHLPIKGKKKFPKYVDGYHGYSLQFKDDNSLMISTKKEGDFLKVSDDKVKIKSLTMPFVPLNVYKCLVKIAFSLMEDKDFNKFKSGISWLMGKKEKTTPLIPHIMLYNPNQKPISKPIALLLKRKIDYNAPEFSFVFIWGFYIFQVFPPFNVLDKNLDFANLKLPIMNEFITKNEEGKFGVSHYDMNHLERIQSLEKITFGLKKDRNIKS
ncbi:hypothetical protein [Lacinutrix mariniflava]|uniref:hypothetical protein n=1 Tax=Lacinutrix mariniflava TaxID=342955 RepID=UPI0006E3FA54|nr:hypothetical protein [Lacinutrix mariniflava]